MSLEVLQQISKGLSELAQNGSHGVVTVQVSPPSGDGIGSGFLHNEQGHVITNAHLFHGNSNTIGIVTADGTSYEGTLIGTDVDTDVAVIKTDIHNPILIPQGDSSRLLIGEFVIAVGSPLSFTTTVTLGVISATGRQLESKNTRPMSDIIQTDAAINPGSSGGPMINTKGEVVGINTAVIRGAQGIGFAIPINTAKSIASLLIDDGEVNRPIIGISIIEEASGVLIEYVREGTSASMAGLQVDDKLLSINKDTIRNTDDAYRLISGLVGQEEAIFGILRDKKEIQIEMELMY